MCTNCESSDCNGCFDTSFITLPTGDPGDNGLSAYEVWLAQGNTGSQQDFLDSLNGNDGNDGNDNVSLVYYSATPINLIATDVDYQTAVTIPLPTLTADGQKYTIQLAGTGTIPPLSNGFACYFYAGGYLHPSATTPTYGNSYFKVPYGDEKTIIEIDVYRVNTTEAYIINKQINKSLLGVSRINEVDFYNNTNVDTSTVTSLTIQILFHAASTFTIESIAIYKYNA